MRLIDADVLKPHKQLEPMGNGKYEYVEVVYKDNIDDSPTIEVEPKWIPCSERLPEESDGTVLVCFPDEFPYNVKEPYVNAKHNQRVRTAYYSQFSNTWYIGDLNAVGEARVIAWMPLPEPYREDVRGKEYETD